MSDPLPEKQYPYGAKLADSNMLSASQMKLGISSLSLMFVSALMGNHKFLALACVIMGVFLVLIKFAKFIPARRGSVKVVTLHADYLEIPKLGFRNAVMCPYSDILSAQPGTLMQRTILTLNYKNGKYIFLEGGGFFDPESFRTFQDDLQQRINVAKS